jgi:hypothetical protein
MTKIGKEKNLSGNAELILQIKEDGKKLDELAVPLRHLQSNLIGLNIVNLRLDELAKEAHKKLTTTQDVMKFIKKYA